MAVKEFWRRLAVWPSAPYPSGADRTVRRAPRVGYPPLSTGGIGDAALAGSRAESVFTLKQKLGRTSCADHHPRFIPLKLEGGPLLAPLITAVSIIVPDSR